MIEDADRDLVLKAQGGDRSAFHALIERHRERAVRVAFSFTGNFADAQDMAQESFVRMYRMIGSFEYRAKFSTWFFQIVVNVCRNFLRHKKRRREIVLRGADVLDAEVPVRQQDSGPTPAEACASRQWEDIIGAAVRDLPERQRDVFILKHMYGWDISEISRILSCAPGTVKAHLFRAVHTLRQNLLPYARADGMFVTLSGKRTPLHGEGSL